MQGHLMFGNHSMKNGCFYFSDVKRKAQRFTDKSEASETKYEMHVLLLGIISPSP